MITKKFNGLGYLYGYLLSGLYLSGLFLVQLYKKPYK